MFQRHVLLLQTQPTQTAVNKANVNTCFSVGCNGLLLLLSVDTFKALAMIIPSTLYKRQKHAMRGFAHIMAAVTMYGRDRNKCCRHMEVRLRYSVFIDDSSVAYFDKR